MDASHGFDSEWLHQWLVDRLPTQGPLKLTKIAGGRSNLTFAVQDSQGRRWILRRPPLHSVEETAHDMAREYRVLGALSDTTVPVPRCVATGSDASGTPFYAMEFVPGVVLRGRDDVEDHLPLDRRYLVTRRLVAALADLHALDPTAVGLDDLGRGTGYTQRQLRLWQRQAESFRGSAAGLSDSVHERLAARLPEGGDSVIVHGDFRLDNAIVEPGTGAIRAIVDWELCTIGDPLIDLAVALSYWTLPSDDVRPLGDSPTLAPGFPARRDIIAMYEDRTGRALPSLTAHLAFARWRLAIVLEGVYARFERGGYGKGAAPPDLNGYPDAASRLVVEAAALLDRE